MTPDWRILVGDARARLADLDDGSVHACITSPPYYGLRDYGHDGQIGLEATLDQYVTELVAVMRDVRRVLRDDGTLWLNLGDSYTGNGGARGGTDQSGLNPSTRRHAQNQTPPRQRTPIREAKPKDLLMVPAIVALALRADGWTLRSEIIWHKPNPMPESVTDRPTRAHETIYLLAKNPRYYYDADAIREPSPAGEQARTAPRRPSDADADRLANGYAGRRAAAERGQGANRRTVWTVPTRPYAGAHFATFPPDLIEPCVIAGAPRRACAECGAPYTPNVERVATGHDGARYGERAVAATGGAKTGGTARSTLGSSNGHGTASRRVNGYAPSCDHDAPAVPGHVLDPFNGAGTTGLVALRNGRAYTGIELNPDYAELARDRIQTDLRTGHRPPERARPVHEAQAALDLFG